MLLTVISFLVLCVAHATAGVVNAVDCQNVTIHSKNVQMEVSGCSSDLDRCPLYQGHNHTVTFLFEPTRAFLNKTDFRVYGIFPKFSVPYGRRADACGASNSTQDNVPCPRQGGFLVTKQYRHPSIFSVSKNYPKIQLSVRFSMTDRSSKETLLCKEIPVEIKNAPSEENEAIH